MMPKDKFIAWIQLTRFDKPVGIELLLYPTLWAVLFAYQDKWTTNQTIQLPNWVFGQNNSLWMTLLIFGVGAVLMRAAGCAINDFADRKVDGKVSRTKNRPLADSRLSAKTAVVTFVALSLLSASLLLFLPIAVLYWSFGAVGLAFIYPFMKRHTHLPQLVLAMAFGWAIPMAYTAVLGVTTIWTWVLFVAYLCWTVAYDTEYAMCDKEDDIKVGIKSTAILFGRFDILIIMGLYAIFAILMAITIGWHFKTISVSLAFGMVFAVAVYRWQYLKIKDRNRWACFEAFLSNVWFGRAMLALVAALMALDFLL